MFERMKDPPRGGDGNQRRGDGDDLVEDQDVADHRLHRVSKTKKKNPGDNDSHGDPLHQTKLTSGAFKLRPRIPNRKTPQKSF